MKEKKVFIKGFSVGLISGVFASVATLFAALASARTIRSEDMTTMVWIFVVAGAIIIILQLIPAFLLFFSFFSSQKEKHQEYKEKGSSLPLPPQRECKTCGNTKKIPCPACGALKEMGPCACCYGNKKIKCPDCNPLNKK